ncbi:MAG: tRNA lysidine(34) synthetase TilS [Pseudomonadota bacterium]|nr:tRNA lysidine(34) synthetase TilS [Pseudomonadota bacterium]
MAFSGGRDSTALLHATARSARALGVDVLALHVHHGLSDAAEDWLRHGTALCAGWTRQGLPVRFLAARIASRPGQGESVEAWARRERYRALRAMALAHGATLVLLAHHRRDQAETFLLQALRAGSPHALSAMPASAWREGITWARPWLSQSAAAVDAYARRHRLGHIDDDTNQDTRLARNRLRARVWPVLLEAFPDAEATLAGAAGQAQLAAAMMNEWAAVDLDAIASIRDDPCLDIASWQALPAGRRSNALRAWLHVHAGGKAASRSLLARLMAELDETTSRRWPVPGGELRSYRGSLRHAILPGSTGQAPNGAMPIDAGRPPTTRIDLHEVGVHVVPSWQGAFIVEPAVADGLPAELAAQLELRGRLPGDRFQAAPDRPARSLKLQYQAARIAPWLRGGPIVSHAGRPVYVPGLGLDARAFAAPGQPCLRISWRPD